MILDRNENRPVAVLLGAGSMGTAILRRVAAAGAFLLSADAAFITGTDLLVDGGTIAALKSGRFGLTIH